MKITLPFETEDNEDNTLTLSDEGFDVLGWVTLQIGEKELGDLHIHELLPTLFAFYEKYKLEKGKDI